MRGRSRSNMHLNNSFWSVIIHQSIYKRIDGWFPGSAVLIKINKTPQKCSCLQSKVAMKLSAIKFYERAWMLEHQGRLIILQKLMKLLVVINDFIIPRQAAYVRERARGGSGLCFFLWNFGLLDDRWLEFGRKTFVLTVFYCMSKRVDDGRGGTPKEEVLDILISTVCDATNATLDG